MTTVRFMIGNLARNTDAAQLAKLLGLELDVPGTTVELLVNSSGQPSSSAMVTVPSTLAHRLASLNGLAQSPGHQLTINRCHIWKQNAPSSSTSAGPQLPSSPPEELWLPGREANSSVMVDGPEDVTAVHEEMITDSPVPKQQPASSRNVTAGTAASGCNGNQPAASHVRAVTRGRGGSLAPLRLPGCQGRAAGGNSGNGGTPAFNGNKHSPRSGGSRPHQAHRPCVLAQQPRQPGFNFNVPLAFCYHMVDIAIHLPHSKFRGDRDEVIQRARETGVETMIVVGMELTSSREGMLLARSHPKSLFCTAGVHPHKASSWQEDSAACLEGLARQSECVAVGECGLDFIKNYSDPAIQLHVFEEQVKLACRLQKPLFLHERGAHEEFVGILAKYHAHLPPVVVHCFTGTREHALRYLAMGFYLGITGFICHPAVSQGLRDLMFEHVLPIDRIMLETFSPFVSLSLEHSCLPAHVLDAISFQAKMALRRSSPNRVEPCALPVLLEVVARCMGRNPQEVAEVVRVTSQSFFALPL